MTQVIYEMQFRFISGTAGRVSKVSEIQQGSHRFCLLRDSELAAAMSNPTRRHSEGIWRRRLALRTADGPLILKRAAALSCLLRRQL